MTTQNKKYYIKATNTNRRNTYYFCGDGWSTMMRDAEIYDDYLDAKPVLDLVTKMYFNANKLSITIGVLNDIPITHAPTDLIKDYDRAMKGISA